MINREILGFLTKFNVYQEKISAMFVQANVLRSPWTAKPRDLGSCGSVHTHRTGDSACSSTSPPFVSLLSCVVAASPPLCGLLLVCGCK